MLIYTKARPVVLKTSFVGLRIADFKGLQRKAWSGSLEEEGRQSSEVRKGFPPTSRLPHAYLTPTPPPTQGKSNRFLRSFTGTKAKWYNLTLRISALALVLLLACSGKRFDNPFDPKNRPAGPSAFSPVDGAEITDNPPDSIAWASVGDSAYYHLQVDDDTLFISLLVDDSLLRAPSKRLLEALPCGWAYWRVRCAKVKGAWGNWSGRHSFFCKYGVVYQDAIFPNGELAINQGLLCVSHNSGFSLYSLQDPIHPQWLGGYQESYWFPRDFQEGYVYSLFATTLPYEMRIYDVRNPRSPVWVGAYPCSLGTAVKASFNRAYLFGSFRRDTMTCGEMQVLDISDPAQPQRLGKWDTLIAQYISSVFRGCTANNGLVYATSYEWGLMAFDCRNSALPRLAGTVEGFYGRKLLLVGNTLYCGGWAMYIRVASLEDPLAPFLLADLSSCGNAFDFTVVDNVLYLLTISSGSLIFYDVSDPRNPRFISRVQRRASNIAVSGDYAYVTGDNGLAVLRVR
jgi:hypothetical protein